MDYTICPNCEKKLNGIMTTKFIVNINTTNYLNHFNPDKKEAYCSGCAQILIDEYTNRQKSEIDALQKELNKLIDIIPIVTMNSPIGWDYKVKGIVSAQSVTGTGFISELSSSFSDLLGNQSNALSQKLNNGEAICSSQLRLKAVFLGGNAILCTDIDYAEVGGGKGMLMVCMAGTAVYLNNASTVIEIKEEKLKTLENLAKELLELNKITAPKSLS